MLSWAGMSYVQVTIHCNRTVLSHFCCTYPSKLSIHKQSAFPQKHEQCFLRIFGPGQMTSPTSGNASRANAGQLYFAVESLMQPLYFAPVSFTQAHTASLGQFASSSAWIQPIQTSIKAFPQADMVFWIHPSIPPYPWWQRAFTEVNKQHFKSIAFAFPQRSSVSRAAWNCLTTFNFHTRRERTYLCWH